MTALVMTVAPTGARLSKADHPNLPLGPAEIAAEIARCCEVGATMAHVHVRTPDGRHSLDPDLYRETIDAIRGVVGDRVVIQITTESGDRCGPAEQMAVVRQVHPEAVSLALRQLIPGDANVGEAAAFFDWLRRERIAPQYILYDPADVVRFHRLRRRGVIPQKEHWALFVLGRRDGPIDVRPRDLLPYLKAHDADYPWAICAFGPSECACAVTAAGLGGHVRVGFENNLWLADGSLAASNAALVEQVVASACRVGRAVADIDTTRRFIAGTAV
jgi:uncharacterized protein (DUF849 family)